MIERVAAAMERHTMAAPGARIGVAVSGGADSVCLLHCLIGLAPRLRLSLLVLHLNHQLRGEESDADEQFVRELALRLELPCQVQRADVRGIAADTRDNLEQAARRVRREFFMGFLKRGELDRIALGHTRSDQAETVLLRFLRGSGTAGLAGMRAVTADGLIRPLIEISRLEIQDYLRGRGIPWREDSSNADRTFARNRVRLDLLPELERDWNPGLAETLASAARVAADEEDYWNRTVCRAVAGQFLEEPPAILFRTDWLRRLPRALARRAVRSAIAAAKGDLRAIDLLHVERILELIDCNEGSGRIQVPGLDVFRSFDWVRLAPPGIDHLEHRNYELTVQAPANITLPHGAGVLALEIGQPATAVSGCGYNGCVTEIDWGRISGSLLVRNWRPGDQYRPLGYSRDTNLKSLFQEARIPLWERRRWPVMICRDTIVWAARFGPAVEFAATSDTRAVLKVRQFGNPTEF